MKTIRLLLSAALLSLSFLASASPITGTFTIPGMPYATITAAVSAINTNGVDYGGVVFNVNAGYTESVTCGVLNITTATTIDANHFITFRKAGTGANPVVTGSGTSSPYDAVISITGSNYITFDAIDVAVSGTAVEYGYLIQNNYPDIGAQHNTIKNCHVVLNQANNASIGIYQQSSSSPTSNAGKDSYNRYHGNYVDNAYCGIIIQSVSSWPDEGCIIDSNKVGTAGANSIGQASGGAIATWGIRVQYASNVTAYGNEVCNVTMPGSKNIGGIFLQDNIGTNYIFNNKVYNIHVTSNSTTSVPIALRMDAPSGSTGYMYNNMAWGFAHGITSPNIAIVCRGISVNSQAAYTGTVNVYFNTVVVNVTAAATSTVLSNGFGTLRMQDNIFVNLSPGGPTSKRYCILIASGTLQTSDNNDLYMASGTNNFFANYPYNPLPQPGGTLGPDIATFANWQSTSGKDAHSVNVNPVFVSSTDLHLNPNANCAIDGHGVSISGITTDIDKDSRETSPTPDIGADEFTGIAATITSTTPGTICDAGTATLYATASSGSVQWWDAATGGNSLGTGNSYTTPNLTSTTNYYAEADNGSCASVTRTAVTATVEPTLPVSVSILADANNVCPNTPVTYTAFPVNEGSSPVYQWQVNLGNVGTNSPTFTYTPNDNDYVSCVLNSSYGCVTGNPAPSNFILMHVGTYLPPVISCPSDINSNNDPGICGKIVTYTIPSGVKDNCAIVTATQIHGLASGSVFPVGTTTNTFEIINSLGQSATCSFTVTITDNEVPVMTCPDIAVPTAAGSCDAIVTFSPQDHDNCNSTTLTWIAGPPSGSLLNAGLPTTITYMSTDASGNSATCNFSVVVLDEEPPVINCSNYTVNTDPAICHHTVNGNEFEPVFSDNCYAYIVNDLNNANSLAGEDLQPGITTVNWIASDNNGNNAGCTSLITVIDNQPPEITCPPDVQANTDAGQCWHSLTVTPATATGICTMATVSGVRSDGLALNLPYHAGITTITWTAIDGQGNTAVCAQLVNITDDQLPTIDCGINVVVNTGVTGNCNVHVTVPGPVATGDNCHVAYYENNKVGTIDASCMYNVGTTTVIWKVVDDYGNYSTCAQLITVIDNEPPTIACAPGKTQTNDAGNCNAAVLVTAPFFNDNCPDAYITNSFNGTANASGTYPVATTIVTWTAHDAHGNTATCTQNIIVTDDELPVINCIAAQTQNVDAGHCSAYVTVAGPQFNDNCPGLLTVINNITHTDNASDTYNVGDNTVVWTVVDNHSNSNTCQQIITINDDELPVINCGNNVTVNTGATGCSLHVDVPGPTTSDNCHVAYYDNNKIGGMDASSTYIVGTTTVTWTVVDDAGNTNTCLQLITVIDDQPPSIQCPGTITICNANDDIGSATATDNCAVASITNNRGSFVAGDNFVTYTATDTHGNTSTCVQHVTLSPQVSVNISQSVLTNYCQGEYVLLTANPGVSPAPVTYHWSTNETTQTIYATTGTYAVTVTNAWGCTATATMLVNVAYNNLISSYVILVNKEVEFCLDKVYSGGVGAKDAHGEVEASHSTMITAAGTFAEAHAIYKDYTSQITTRNYTPVTVPWPAFQSMPYHASYNSSISVSSGHTVTLTDTLYKEIKVGKNATVIFTKPVVNIETSLRLNDGATVKFSGCAKVRIKGDLYTGSNVSINPAELSIVFYIGGNATFGGGNYINGVYYCHISSNPYTEKCGIYYPETRIYIYDSRSTRPGIFKGLFIADEMYVHCYNNFYLAAHCNYCTPAKELTEDAVTNEQKNEAVVKNYPNPFSSKTTLLFKLPEDNRVKLEVYDLTGKWIQTLYNGAVSKGQEYNVEFDGSALPTGIYIYRMTTNTDVVTGKMMLVKE